MKQDSKTSCRFYLGKGGVGKSTSSALTAIHLAETGNDVLLVSMDPAHNLSDIFEREFSEKPFQLSETLEVKEIDINYWIKKYLSEVESQIRRTYSYLSALNLEQYFGVIKYSPGIEEYALLLAYREILNKYKEKDYIIFDMPPTALTLKFFGLPEISLLWLEKLLDLRNEIIKKREIITRVKFGDKEIERDKILNKLNQQVESYREVKEVFSDKARTKINLVMNQDKLSFSESELIVKKLNEFNLGISDLIINKYYPKFSFSHIGERFTFRQITLLPGSDIPLIGLQTLKKYLLQKAPFENSFATQEEMPES
jgi:arsenite/tail-anchored protein-transporting ATPase